MEKRKGRYLGTYDSVESYKEGRKKYIEDGRERLTDDGVIINDDNYGLVVYNKHHTWELKHSTEEQRNEWVELATMTKEEIDQRDRIRIIQDKKDKAFDREGEEE